MKPNDLGVKSPEGGMVIVNEAGDLVGVSDLVADLVKESGGDSSELTQKVEALLQIYCEQNPPNPTTKNSLEDVLASIKACNDQIADLPRVIMVDSVHTKRALILRELAKIVESPIFIGSDYARGKDEEARESEKMIADLEKEFGSQFQSLEARPLNRAERRASTKGRQHGTKWGKLYTKKVK